MLKMELPATRLAAPDEVYEDQSVVGPSPRRGPRPTGIEMAYHALRGQDADPSTHLHVVHPYVT